MKRERERDPLNTANSGVLQAGAVSSQIREFPRLIVAFYRRETTENRPRNNIFHPPFYLSPFFSFFLFIYFFLEDLVKERVLSSPFADNNKRRDTQPWCCYLHRIIKIRLIGRALKKENLCKSRKSSGRIRAVSYISRCTFVAKTCSNLSVGRKLISLIDRWTRCFFWSRSKSRRQLIRADN